MPFRIVETGKIAVFDDNAPRVITFDPWPQVIFLEATGHRTITQFVIDMANGYNKEVPKSLEETIITEIERMVQNNLISLSNVAVQLDKRLLEPLRK